MWPSKVPGTDRIDADEFYKLLDGVVIDDTGLFSARLIVHRHGPRTAPTPWRTTRFG